MLQFKSIIIYIFIIGAAQAVLLSIFLFNKQENKIANRLLAVTMLIFSVDLFNGVMFLTGNIKGAPFLIGLSNTFPYLYGPLIYIYTILLGHNKEGFKRSYALHFIPFLLVQIYALFFFYFEGAAYQLSLMDLNIPNPWHIELIGKLIPISGITYVILTLKEVSQFNNNIKESYSNIDRINLKWLTYLVIWTAIIWTVVIVSYLLDFIFGDELQANLLIYITMSLFLYALGIKSLRQPQIVMLDDGEEETSNGQNNKTDSYKKSGLTEEAANTYLEKLMKIMENEKPYINNGLNLSDLSELVDISTHNLSEIINRKLKNSFYDFINNYRVDEVKRLIVEDENANFSILALGFDAGFSSKSAFYSSFKRVCGITPAQYRDELNPKRVA